MILRLVTSLTLCALLVSTAVAQPSKKPLRAAGRVDAVSQESVTIVLPGNDKLILRVDKATKVTGRGAELRTAGAAPAGQRRITDLVRAADSVVVTYLGDAMGGPLATEIHVRLVAR